MLNLKLKRTLLTVAFLTLLTTFYGFEARFAEPATDAAASELTAVEPTGPAALPLAESYQISVYDNIIRRISGEEGNDWRLMSAIAYHESRFTPDIVSRRGAKGLMQIMPSVARQFAVDPERRGDLCTNIRLANLLLNRLDSLMRFSAEAAVEDRLCLLLAAYNSGYGHVSDARRLARAHGEDAESWEVVSRYLRLKSDPAYLEHEAVHHGAFGGSDETLAYVDDVRARYAAYCRKAPR